MPAVRCAILLAALACGGCMAAASSGSGQVLDWSTHEPIAGARVALVCTRPHWLQVEGEVIVRTVNRTTDGAGHYSFSLADQRGCARTFVTVSKPGYVLADSKLLNGHITLPAPGIEYLAKDSDAVWYELQRITPSPTSAITNPDGTPSTSGAYVSLFMPFFEAKRIATTPRELAFVHEHYCARLQALYAKLTDDDKEHIAKLGVTYSFHGKYESGTLDHAEVSTYCAKP